MLFAPAGPLAGRTPLESRLRCMFGMRRRVLLQACIYKVIRGDDGIRPKQGIEKLIVVILVIVRIEPDQFPLSLSSSLLSSSASSACSSSEPTSASLKSV